jgi:hypothetical protein
VCTIPAMSVVKFIRDLVCHFGVPNRIITNNGSQFTSGPRAASNSRSARSMLPAGRGAIVTTATGDGVLRAPPGAGPRRVKAMEVPGAARFATLCGGALMRRDLRRRVPTGRELSACSGCPEGAHGV